MNPVSPNLEAPQIKVPTKDSDQDYLLEPTADDLFIEAISQHFVYSFQACQVPVSEFPDRKTGSNELKNEVLLRISEDIDSEFTEFSQETFFR